MKYSSSFILLKRFYGTVKNIQKKLKKHSTYLINDSIHEECLNLHFV